MYDLSIIIPHYNSLNTLENLLNSVPLNKAIQVIVVDDKSDIKDEQIEKMLADVSNNNITFLKNKTNKKGAGVSRNIGLETATGKFILFADSDDYFVKGFYNKLIPFLNSDNDIVYFSPTSIDINTKKMSDRHIQYKELVDNYLKNENSKDLIKLKYEFYVPWSKLYRYEFLKKNNIRFDEFKTSEDVLFSAKAGYYMEKYAVSNETIYCVTKGEGSLTTIINRDNYYAKIIAYSNYSSFLKERLSESDYNTLGINGRHLLANGIKNKLNFGTLLSSYIMMRKNGLIIFEFKLLNPFFLFSKLKSN